MRGKLRGRYVLPGLMVVGVSLTGLLTAGASAGTTSGPGPSPATPASSTQALRPADPVTYRLPPSSYVAPGQNLFEANCSSCHGTDALGTERAPNLVGLGGATVDFWVSTGRMPLAISSLQAVRKPPRFDRTQTLQIVAFVASLAPAGQNGPAVPAVDTAHADLANGNSLFVLNCAGCHTVTGAGDALADGYFAPSLHRASATQVAEAIRTGPGNMPRFGPGAMSDRQVSQIVAFVTGPIQHPDNRGGLGLGGIGPVAEGFIGLLIGVGGLMLIAFWIGDRA
ncbi:MAG TPA: c-type cytochrome [Acidimicrobiales bacterium]|nr:c-type cytochrome [Acidimicrobiales bacterium]